ncbi:MAG: hypothetical protein ACM3NH_04370 [Candidatus Saccharibacteria bacterium]
MNPETNRGLETEIDGKAFEARHETFIEKHGNETYESLRQQLSPAEAQELLVSMVGAEYLERRLSGMGKA